MALLHKAELSPTKIELVRDWAPTQPWFPGGDDLETIGAFRFDDPDGEVGIETLLVRAGDVVVQVPLTYRNAPLAGGEAFFITTMQHSVLGERWVYDAVGDPVYLQAVTTTIVDGGQQAELEVQVDGQLVRREPTALVKGHGSAGRPVPAGDVGAVSVRSSDGWTHVTAGEVRLDVARTIALTADAQQPGTLTGTWSGQDEPRLLVRMAANDAQ